MSSTIEARHGLSMPRALLHLEGAAVFILATLVYFLLGHPWWIFLLFLLAPDLSAIGYAFGMRAGSIIYNLAHITVWPLAIGVVGWWLGWSWAAPVALIWLAHIGMDRMIGYGLKYPDAFKHTHLNQV
jgi:hypothetical protein